MGPIYNRIHLGLGISPELPWQNDSVTKSLFRDPFLTPKRSPGQNADLGIQNPILGSKIGPWAWKNKRCGLKNHAESSPRNSKRSHIVQVMAKNHFGGYLPKSWNILGANPILKEGNPAFKKGTPAFKKENPACKKGNPAFKKENPACKKGNPACTKGNPGFKKGNPAFKKGTMGPGTMGPGTRDHGTRDHGPGTRALGPWRPKADFWGYAVRVMGINILINLHAGPYNLI